MNSIVSIMGPTAVGKTELSLQLAKAFCGEIISVDSRQIYRYLDIGTAKPSPLQREVVPHYLIDFLSPFEQYTVGRFQKEAQKYITQILNKGCMPFLVGGTGLYFRSILEGFEIPEAPFNSYIRDALKQEAVNHGTDKLYQRLLLLDPIAAQKIHPNDLYRIIRALEIYTQTGRPISQRRKKSSLTQYKFINIGLTRDREDLYTRINTRVEGMFAEGLIGEVDNLRKQHFEQSIGFQKTIGYIEVLYYLEGLLTAHEAKQVIAQKTRNYAKRQMTWFRKEKNLHWFNLSDQAEGKIFQEIFSFMAGELEKNENIKSQ